MKAPDPLRVVCPVCRAGVGMRCFDQRSINSARGMFGQLHTLRPHRARRDKVKRNA